MGLTIQQSEPDNLEAKQKEQQQQLRTVLENAGFNPNNATMAFHPNHKKDANIPADPGFCEQGVTQFHTLYSGGTYTCQSAVGPVGPNAVVKNPALPDVDPTCVEPATPAFWSNAKGEALHVRSAVPSDEKPIKGTVFYLHGYGSHANNKGTLGLMKAWSDAGYAVFGIDMIGHGYSPGMRGLVCDFDAWVQDVIGFVSTVMTSPTAIGAGFNLDCSRLQDIQQGTFMFFGASTGGTIAMMAGAKLGWMANVGRKFRGVATTAPILTYGKKEGLECLELFLLGVFSTMPYATLPEALADTKVRSSEVYKSPEDQKCSDNDEWGAVNGGLQYKGSAALGTVYAYSKLESQKARIVAETKFPLLIFQDTKDPLVEKSGTEFIMKHSPSSDKTWIKTSAGLHAVLANTPKHVGTLLKWMNKHL